MAGVSPEHGWTCSAFPGGIPVQVLCRQISHREPIEGDGGVVFEPAILGQEMRADDDEGKDIELNTNDAPLLAAGVMYLTDDGQVLFLRRSDTGLWAFPGGKIEEGESAQQAARRECEEEIGHSPQELRPWTRRILDGVDFTTFVARVPEPFDPKLNDEHTEYSWEPLGDHSGRSLDHLMGGIHQLVQPTLDEVRADTAETRQVVMKVDNRLDDADSQMDSLLRRIRLDEAVELLEKIVN